MAFNIYFSGKTVIITGVSSGISTDITKSFASANASIAGCAIEPTDQLNVQKFIQRVSIYRFMKFR